MLKLNKIVILARRHFMPVALHQGDCLDVLKTLSENSVDSIITDPPAGISFMGKHWDSDKGGRDYWITWMTQVSIECLRVIKPGGYALVWALPRTSHWTATAWENAGWEVRDRIAHLFGSGFPKSTSHLKPACEDWWLLRKPLIGSVANNVLVYGTGALNIDTCRVESDGEHKRPFQPTNNKRNIYGSQCAFQPTNAEGRWPANVTTDGSDEVLDGFATFGAAARFYYAAKASKSERNGSKHPTIKPVSLMCYLCKLVTPPNGVVLDPFAGSGTTGEAAVDEGFNAILIEQEPEYCKDIRWRLALWLTPQVLDPAAAPQQSPSLSSHDASQDNSQGISLLRHGTDH